MAKDGLTMHLRQEGNHFLAANLTNANSIALGDHEN